MIRPDYILHELPTNEWTPEEIFSHLKKTFENACAEFPDIMEPYLNRMDDDLDSEDIKRFMREALRETFIARWPNRFSKINSEAIAGIGGRKQ